MSQGGPSFKRFFSKKSQEEKVEEEILYMVEEGHEQGIIEENEVEMISNIFEFGDKEVRTAMTNRKRIIAVEHTMTTKEVLQFIIENNYSRYPVYDGDIDNIIGVIHLKDLMEAYLKDPDKQISEICEKPMFIHPTYNISKLFQKMQHEKIHMSIVVDEYGQTEGLITMEDIIEEIVGNIFDEHDEEVDVVRRLSDGKFIVDGSAKLDELGESLEIDFSNEEIETLNGFLLFELGRLPVENEKIEIIYQEYKFTPVKICDKMIKLVRIEKIKQEEA